jgi:hypothetical protein
MNSRPQHLPHVSVPEDQADLIKSAHISPEGIDAALSHSSNDDVRTPTSNLNLRF